MAGRPTKYNEKVAKRILNLYAGGKTMTDIQQKGMPSRWSVYKWRAQYPEFGKLWDLAVECCSDAKIESVMHRIDTCIDTRQAKLLDVLFKSTSWYVSKINRSRYGDKIDIDITKTLDISPALAEAIKRMSAIPGNGQKVLNVPCEIIA